MMWVRFHSKFDKIINDHYNGYRMYRLLFVPSAKKDYDALRGKLKSQVDRALDRICKDPYLGKPLGGELKGLRSERVSSFRILYRIYEKTVEIIILVIKHRRSVYGGH